MVNERGIVHPEHGISALLTVVHGSPRSTNMGKNQASTASTTETTETAVKTGGAIEFPDIADAASSSRDPNVPSIRRICREGLLEGRSTASITAVIKQFHPNSAAAVKSSKHIGYYRAQLKAEGKLKKS